MTSATSRRELLKQAAYCSWLIAASGVATSVHAAGARHSVAQLRTGKIGGVRDRAVHVFKGVPYGADTAARRFLPPVAVNSWKGLRDAHEYGPACPQPDAKEPVSEDCLRLNVWTPALRDGAKRPVMVYIHGGEYSTDIPLVFDNISQPGSLTGADAAAQQVADRMSDAFIAFARSGDPNHAGLPQWRPYELSTRSTMLFDVECKLADDPRGGERRLFAQVPYIQRGTY